MTHHLSLNKWVIKNVVAGATLQDYQDGLGGIGDEIAAALEDLDSAQKSLDSAQQATVSHSSLV